MRLDEDDRLMLIRLLLDDRLCKISELELDSDWLMRLLEELRL